MKYRADINGLRAIAVLAVVANHVEIPLFQGGYFGVDVFFVISGYLISGLIYAEVKAEHFSIGNFYERRIRRIFPALAAVFLATLLLAYIYFLPSEIKNYSKSLLAATFCVSNIYFWFQSGYFEALATVKPLLHTWSLAVEEQFYVVYPVLLILGYRLFRRKLDVFIIVLLFLSLILGAAAAFYRPVAAFYLAPARAWELLLGAVVSLESMPQIRTAAARNVATLIGIGLIGASIVIFSGNTLYPGLASVFPCVGSALIIAAGRSGGSLVGSFLSTRPMVFIGLISYSLYLWHWPIIVFHRNGFIPTDGLAPNIDRAIIIAISIAVSALSWKYIENPFRSKRLATRTVYRTALASVALLVLASVGLLATQGLPARFSPQVSQVASYLDYDAKLVARDGTCFLTINSRRDFDTDTCLHEEAGKKNYLLIGDSHAAHLYYGLATVFPEVNIMQATSAGCKPTVDPAHHEDKRRCRKLMDSMYDEYLPTHKVDALLIEAIWREEDLPLLPHTLDYAKAHAGKVILFGPMVQYDSALPRLLAVSFMKDDPAYPGRHRLDYLAELDDQMSKIAREKGVTYVSFFKMLCTPKDCETSVEKGVPMLYDYGHLTVAGSVQVATDMRADGSVGY